MANDLLLPIALLIAITVWMAVAHAVRVHKTRLQQEIASRGACCQGKVVAIQRPFMLERCTRLYFDFEPPEEPVPCAAAMSIAAARKR